MSDNNITDAAEARRQRFLEGKKESGGSAEKLMEKLESRPWRLYFDDSGVIQCFTQDPDIKPNNDWKTHNFSQDQLGILKNKDIRKYHVVVDPKIENVYSIELKPLETVKLPTVDDFLYEVTAGDQSQAEIICSIQKDSLILRIGDDAKAEYADIYPVSATRNGYRILRFYITKAQDPHIMYEYKNVGLADLLIETEVKIQLGMDLEHCSIYTNKIFDKYVRV